MGSPIDSIDIVGDITRPALDEVVALTSTKDALPRRLLDYYVFAFGLAQGTVMAYYGIRGVISYSFGPDRNVVRFLFSLAVTAVPIGFAMWLARMELSRRRLLRALLGPVTLSITASGISGSAPGHHSQSWQWDECRGYYVGRHAIVCLPSKDSGFIVIPVGSLSSGELARVRTHLAAHTAEMDFSQLRDSVRQSFRKA